MTGFKHSQVSQKHEFCRLSRSCLTPFFRVAKHWHSILGVVAFRNIV